jgi:hypothetical protein
MALAELRKRNRCRRIAGDHDRLHVSRHKRIGELYRVVKHLRVASRPIWMPCAVTDIDR